MSARMVHCIMRGALCGSSSSEQKWSFPDILEGSDCDSTICVRVSNFWEKMYKQHSRHIAGSDILDEPVMEYERHEEDLAK